MLIEFWLGELLRTLWRKMWHLLKKNVSGFDPSFQKNALLREETNDIVYES